MATAVSLISGFRNQDSIFMEISSISNSGQLIGAEEALVPSVGRKQRGQGCQWNLFHAPLLRPQHLIPVREPLPGIFAVHELVEVRATEGVVDVGHIGIGRVVIYQMVPAMGNLADQVVAVQPFELMQFQAGRAVHVLRRQGAALGVVEQHDAGPVLLAVWGLRRVEELDGFPRYVVMLDAHHRVTVVAQVPQLGDVVLHQHVAVHEQAPALIVGKVGGEEAREGKVRGLQGVPLTVHQRSQVLECKGGESHRLAGARQDAVHQHVPGHRFPGIESDEESDHDLFSCVGSSGAGKSANTSRTRAETKMYTTT